MGQRRARRQSSWARRANTRTVVAVAILAFAATGLAACRPVAAPPGPPDRAVPAAQSIPGPPCLANPMLPSRIACENTAPGTPQATWDITGSGDPSIQGYAQPLSVNPGSPVSFRVNTDARLYHLEIYRLGYYGGNGARLVAIVRPGVPLPQHQAACGIDASLGLYDCSSWAESASWTPPADAVSGVYLAKLVRDSGNPGSSHIVFVVRDDTRRSDLLFQTSDTTWAAYNTYGGYGSYLATANGHQAYYMSYNRPFSTRSSFGGQSWVFNAEYPMIRFLEANGYDMSYTTGGDVDRNGAALLNHKVFMSVGHDEYWSAQQRANVQAARDAGVHLAFFSGDAIYWKTRWLNNNSWLVTYKESLVGFSPSPGKLDPAPVWTGLWRDPRFSPPYDGGRPENQLSGNLYTSQSTGAIQVPADEGRTRFWRNTTVANLAPGTVAALPSGTLGYEWDEDVDTGAIAQLLGVAPAGARFRPPGEIRLSSTQPPLSAQSSTQNRETQAPNVSAGAAGTVHSERNVAATHHVTLYRAPSGAMVFSAGTVQWSWGLDSHHDNGSAPADPRMQQATVNLLADMGSQPQTLLPGLVPATASSDTTPPVSTIVTPITGGDAHVGQPVAITGTAVDTGGGVVAGVEVSTDGGTSWNPATGTTQWSYSWVPTAVGPATIQVRATDDCANLETPGAGVTITVG